MRNEAEQSDYFINVAKGLAFKTVLNHLENIDHSIKDPIKFSKNLVNTLIDRLQLFPEAFTRNESKVNMPPNDYPISGHLLAKLGFEYDYQGYSKNGFYITGQEGLQWQIWNDGMLTKGIERHISTVGELLEYLGIHTIESKLENQ